MKSTALVLSSMPAAALLSGRAQMAPYSQDALAAGVKVPSGHVIALQTVGAGQIAYECRAKKVCRRGRAGAGGDAAPCRAGAGSGVHGGAGRAATKAPGRVVQTTLRNQLSLTPLGATTVPSHKALQFWTKDSNWSGPRSLGLVQAGQSRRMALDQLPPVQSDQLFEITLEPETGSPTGPVLYIGKAVKVM